uniref:Membrane bound transcriptional regulator-like protein n=1 Tax=Paulinella chromatophora TaxID=39717 RepID=B1X4H2_PAUCH|nr:membrane bound transcriptional regulator-like protein [Paulinella chromatophora]ACB42841.1 membrane bound transcriptional regulator-like protein [Paulinella chromatophora]
MIKQNQSLLSSNDKKSITKVFTYGLSFGFILTKIVNGSVTVIVSLLFWEVFGMPPLINAPEIGGRQVLIIGTDQVANNTDVLLAVGMKKGKLVLTQIPRDTITKAQGKHERKINSIYVSGGVKALKQEVSILLHGKVDRHLIVNMSVVTQLAKALGGIKLQIDKRLYYIDKSQNLTINIEPGKQTLNGKDLEGFIRWRNDGEGDIGRLKRQRLILSAIFDNLKRPNIIKHLPELLVFLNTANFIQTDLSVLEIVTLLITINICELDTRRLSGQPIWIKDLNYWLADTNPFYTNDCISRRN